LKGPYVKPFKYQGSLPARKSLPLTLTRWPLVMEGAHSRTTSSGANPTSSLIFSKAFDDTKPTHTSDGREGD
jgi:hypothetical protein